MPKAKLQKKVTKKKVTTPDSKLVNLSKLLQMLKKGKVPKPKKTTRSIKK